VLDIGDAEHCPNLLCRSAERAFALVRAVGVHTQALQVVLHRYKVEARREWADVLARLLLGYLGERHRALGACDLIVASPTYLGPGGRRFDHVGLILEHAARLSQAPGARRWPFAVDVVAKEGPTQPLKACRTYRERVIVARTQIRPVLRIASPERVRGARVIVFDDVFTEGLTLHEVGRSLLGAGAAEVRGLVLARQPLTS